MRADTTTHIAEGRPASAEAILDGLVDGVIEVDSSWRITYVNLSATRVFGRPREKIIGCDLWQEFPDLDATPFGPACEKAMTERTSERVEGEYAPLGSWFEARVFPAPNERLVVFFRDIGDRIESERALTDTRALLDAVMRFSTSLIYAKDSEGRFTLVNRKLENLLGFAHGALVGKTDHDIFPREFADPFRENDRTVLRERRPLTVEEQIVIDGQLRTNLSVKFPLERPDGTVFGTAGVSTDITERVRHLQETRLLAEIGLRMSESLDWDACSQAIVDVVAERFADYCVLYVRDEGGALRSEAVAARDPARLVRIREALTSSPDLTADAPFASVMRDGRTERVTDADPAWRETNERSPVRQTILDAVNAHALLVVPLAARGRALGLLEILSASRRFDDRDQATAEEIGRLCGLALDNARLFAEGKRREEALQSASEQLEHEASLRELFMAVLAHDLRNPLNAIQIGAGALVRRDDVAGPVSQVAQRIISSARRMGTLIEQVLDLTRARAMGGIPVERRRVQLDAVVESVVQELRTAHPSRVIEVAVRGDCSGSWDPDRLAQAVSNLVGNAVTHGTPDTPVRLELVGNGNVTLTVHNESAPIAPELLATLFDPFRRGATASPAGRRGLGLGLYITDQIVRAHGGSIVAQSDAGGTSFRVTLPR